MQKWEYLEVIPEAYSSVFSQPRYLNSVEIKDWKKGPGVHEFIAQLGDEGWELVGFSGGNALRYWFKRPKL